MARSTAELRRSAHRCRCSECGDLHVRFEAPLPRFCARCFEWLAPGSRAKYCGPACREAARRVRPAPVCTPSGEVGEDRLGAAPAEQQVALDA